MVDQLHCMQGEGDMLQTSGETDALGTYIGAQGPANLSLESTPTVASAHSCHAKAAQPLLLSFTICCNT